MERNEYSCEICPKTFSYKRPMQMHKKAHIKPVCLTLKKLPFKHICRICGECCREKRLLTTHKFKHFLKKIHENPTGKNIKNLGKAEELSEDEIKDVDKYIDESLHSNHKSKASTAQREAKSKATTYTAITKRNNVGKNNDEAVHPKDKTYATTTATVDIERNALDHKSQAMAAPVTKRNDNEITSRANYSKFYVHDEICLTPKF